MMALLLAAQVEHYLTRAEALKIALPGADRLVEARLHLSPAQQERIRARLRRPVEADWTITVGLKDEGVVGFAAVTEAVGKYQPITFIVGVTPEARVRDVAVMTYREPVGAEVRDRRYLDQLPGKGGDSALTCTGARRDLMHISGATMSCDAVALGTRTVLSVVEEGLVNDPAALRRILQDEPVVQGRMRMGTLLRIKAYGPGAADAVAAAFEEVSRLEKILTNYDPESELMKMNAAAGKGPQAVGKDLVEFLKVCRAWTDATGGAFDPTVGPAVRAWGFMDRKYRLPSDEELKALRARIGPEKWTLGEKVDLKVEGMEVDPGGLGKGWAVDRVVALLKERGITAALVDFGSSQYGLGAPPGKEGWKIAIRDPFKADGFVQTVLLKDRALTTSGGYEKVFELKGVRYGHIFDPRTLKPVQGMEQTSVLTADATAGDALATALYVLGSKEGPLLAAKSKVEAIWIASDKAKTATEGWPKDLP